MTIKEIVEKYLLDNKYDGLYNDFASNTCHCLLDYDDNFMRCEAPSDGCMPGVKLFNWCKNNCTDELGCDGCPDVRIGPKHLNPEVNK